MKIEKVALIIRKLENGEVMIFGTGFEVSRELTPNDPAEEDHLVLGSMEILEEHVFNGYKKDAGNTPDELLTKGGLDHKLYKNKLK